MLEILIAPHSGPVWAVLGVIVTQIVHLWLGSRKQGVDTITAANQAHVNLNKSLQQSFDMMAKELERLRKDHEEEVERYQARIRALEAELARMRALLTASDVPLDLDPPSGEPA